MANLRLALVCSLFVSLVCFTCVSSLAKSDPSYVDPTDVLNFDAINMRMKDHKTQQPPDGTRTEQDSKAGSQACPPCPPCANASKEKVCAEVQEKHASSLMLLRQYSLSLVRLMEAHVGSTSRPTLLDIRASATYHGLAKLRKFGEGSSSDVHALHETLTSLMHYAKPVAHESFFSRFYWLEDKLGLSFPMMAYATVLMLSCVLLVVAVGHIRWRKELVWTSLLVMFIASVVMTMIEMYQEKVAEQEELLMESVKKHCPKMEEMSVWERIFSFATASVYFKDDKCKQYMKAMLVHPMVAISPMQALAVALVKTVVSPMELIGQGIKAFLVGLLKDLPVQLQTFVLVCLFVFLILWPLLLMGYNFNFFYLINIGPARVEREIQYVHAEPILDQANERVCEQENNSRDQQERLAVNTPHNKESQIVPVSESSVRLRALPSAEPAASLSRREEPTNHPSTSTSGLPVWAVPQTHTVQTAKADTTSELRKGDNQRDGGDAQTGYGVEDREVTSAAQTMAAGDGEKSEVNNAELCRKLAKVDISGDDMAGQDKRQDCRTDMIVGSGLVDKLADPSSSHTDSAGLTAGLHRLNLEDAKNSLDGEGTVCSSDTIKEQNLKGSESLSNGKGSSLFLILSKKSPVNF